MKLDYQETTLPNGVRVLTSNMPHVRSVSCGIWVGIGGRYESARQSGASHFIEHLLFKGSKKRSARAISQAIEGRGGYFNAFTQEESTCYYARIGAAHAWKVLDILSDMYLHPRFAPVDIDKERGVILEEIMMYRDQPHQLVQDFLGELLWTNHPVGRPLIGPPENIVRMTRDDLSNFKSQKYTGANTRVAFAGCVDHDTCVARVATHYASLGKSRAPKARPVNTQTPQRPIRIHAKEVEQAHLAMGFRLFGRSDERRFALKLLSVILGENMSSRLFQVVREKHGMAYSIHSATHLFSDTGALIISAGLERARVKKALSLILTEIERLMERPVAGRELQRAKDYAIGQLEIGMESSIAQMMWIGENNVSFGHLIQPLEVIEKLRAVTVEDLQELAQHIFSQDRTSVSMILPDTATISESDVFESLNRLG